MASFRFTFLFKVTSPNVLQHYNDVIENFYCISLKQVLFIVDFAIGGISIFINSHKVLEHSNNVSEIFHCISRKQV